MLAFALMAVVLGELGVRLKERTLEVFALILLGFLSWAFIALAVEMYSHSTMTGYTDYAHRFVLRSLYFLPLIGAMTFAAVRLCATTRWLANMRTVLVVGASSFLFIYVSAESAWFGKIYLPTLKTGLMTIVWAGSAFGLLAFGIARRLAPVRYVGLGLLGLSVLKLLFIDTASLATPGRVCVFAAVGILMIVGAFLYLKFKTAFEKEM